MVWICSNFYQKIYARHLCAKYGEAEPWRLRLSYTSSLQRKPLFKGNGNSHLFLKLPVLR